MRFRTKNVKLPKNRNLNSSVALWAPAHPFDKIGMLVLPKVKKKKGFPSNVVLIKKKKIYEDQWTNIEKDFDSSE